MLLWWGSAGGEGKEQIGGTSSAQLAVLSLGQGATEGQGAPESREAPAMVSNLSAQISAHAAAAVRSVPSIASIISFSKCRKNLRPLALLTPIFTDAHSLSSRHSGMDEQLQISCGLIESDEV